MIASSQRIWDTHFQWDDNQARAQIGAKCITKTLEVWALSLGRVTLALKNAAKCFSPEDQNGGEKSHSGGNNVLEEVP